MSTEKRKLIAIETDDDSSASSDSGSESDVSITTLRRRVGEKNLKARLLTEDSSDEDPGDIPAKSGSSLEDTKIAVKEEVREEECSEWQPDRSHHPSVKEEQYEGQLIEKQGSNVEEKTVEMKEEVEEVSGMASHSTDTSAQLDDQHTADQGKHDEYERVTAAKRWCESSKSRPEVSRQERLNSEERKNQEPKETICVKPKVMKKKRGQDDVLKLCVAGQAKDMAKQKLKEHFPDATHISVENKSSASVWFSNQKQHKDALKKYANKPPYIVLPGGTVTYHELLKIHSFIENTRKVPAQAWMRTSVNTDVTFKTIQTPQEKHMPTVSISVGHSGHGLCRCNQELETYISPLTLVASGVPRNMTKQELKVLFPLACSIRLSTSDLSCAYLHFACQSLCQETLKKHTEKPSSIQQPDEMRDTRALTENILMEQQDKIPRKEGDIPRKGDTPSKEGDTPRKEEDTPREGDAHKKEDTTRKGDAPRKEKDTPRKGDAPRKEEDTPKKGDTPRKEEDTPRKGDTPRKEGDTPRKEEDTPRKEEDTPRKGDTHRKGDTTRKGDTPRKEEDTPRKEEDTPRKGDTHRKGDTPRNEGSPSSKASDIDRLLLEASKTGDLVIVKNLLKDKANVNAKDKSGQTPLIKACSCGHKDVAELLLKKGARVNEVDQWEYSALHEAASKDHRVIFSLLVKYGADRALRNIYGDCPQDILYAKATATASATNPAKPAVATATTTIKATTPAKPVAASETTAAKSAMASPTTAIKATSQVKHAGSSETTAANPAVATVTTVKATTPAKLAVGAGATTVNADTLAKPAIAAATTMVKPTIQAKPAVATGTTTIKATTTVKPGAASEMTVAKPAETTGTTTVKAKTPAKPAVGAGTTAVKADVLAKPVVSSTTTAIQATTLVKHAAVSETTAVKPAVDTVTTVIKVTHPAIAAAESETAAAKPMETDDKEMKRDEEQIEPDDDVEQNDPRAFTHKRLGDDKTLFINNLPSNSTKKMIRDFFKGYPVTKVCQPQKAKWRKRYAFVVFKTPQVLEKAMAEKKGQKLNRSRVVLEYTEERRQFINKPGRMKSKPPELSMSPAVPNISQKNPVVHLNELRPTGVKYNLVSESWVDHNRQFTMKVTVDGQDFEGTGWNKKSAKTEAAKSAVNKIFNILTVPNPPMATRSQTQQKQQTVHEKTTPTPNDKDAGCRNDGSKPTGNQEKHGVNSNCIPSLLNLNLETPFIQGSTVTHPNRKRSLDSTAAASGKRRCATVQSEPSPIKNAKYDISLSAYKQDQTASSMDTSNQRTSEVKSVCHRIQGNTSEMKTAHNLSQDTSSQSHEKYGPEIEAFTSLRRPVGGYNNETKLDSAHENKAQPKTIDPTNRANAVSHTSNGSKLTSSLNQSRNNDSEDSILGHGEVRRQSESTTVHNKCVIMGDVKKEQNRNTGSCDSQRRSTPVTCPCGANKKRCRKWKKSKRVYNTKKLLVKGLEVENQTDILKMFRAKKVQMKEEIISGEPLAYIWFDTEKDCHDMLKKYRRQHSLVLKLATASHDDSKADCVTLHELKVRERKKRKH